MNNKNKGFTLIEMLIVVVIIGVLSSIVLVGVGSFRSRARDSKRVAEIAEIQKALEIYYTKCNHYPGAKNGNCGTVALPAGGAASYGDMRDAILAANIGVSQLPVNDPLGNAYTYGAPVVAGGSPGPQNYALGTILEDTNNPALANMPTSVTTIYTNVTCGQPARAYCVQY